MENKNYTAYFLARLTMGVNIMIHGLVRLPKIDVFQGWIVEQFHDSILPLFVVKTMGLTLPFVESLIGLLIVLGIATRKSLVAGAILILLLITGSALIEHWEWVGIQMIYALYYFFLLIYIDQNYYSVDRLLKPKFNH